jgi:uncharacterized delta-60 repeat protein
MASLLARIASLTGLVLLFDAAAWAGRGDIDPNYGEGGRLVIGPSVPLALPDDRFVTGEAVLEGFRVRVVDAIGQKVAAFGEDGVVLIDSSTAARTFLPEAAALAPNGDMIFVGSRSDSGARALLRLDKYGQPVNTFGSRGDGFVEPTVATALMGVTVDSAGKIVFLEGIANPDNICGYTAQMWRLLANGQPDAGFGEDGRLEEIPNLDLPNQCVGAPVFGARADGGVIVGDGHTIVAVDAAGEIDPTFGVDGRLDVTELTWASGLLLPEGGLLIFGSNDEAASSNDTVFLKFDRNGQPDLDFGAGTGSVTIDLGAVLLGEHFDRANVEQLTLDPDGEHVVAHLSAAHADGSLACKGIARLTIAGTPDTGFGRNGLTCLNVSFWLIAVQSDGAPLFWLFDGIDNPMYRLLQDASPSPGFLRVVATSRAVGEFEGTATVAIERLAGRDGAVSVNYTTAYRASSGRVNGYPRDVPATADSDYTATSGRLDWASGDDSQRIVTVRILNDDIDEHPREIFGVDLSEPSGGVQLLAAGSSILIADDDNAASPPPPPPPPSGGGGSASWATSLALLTLLFVRRRRNWLADQIRH